MVTLDRVIQDFLVFKEKVRGRSPKTIESYGGILRLFKEFMGTKRGHVYARDFTRELVEEWSALLHDRGLDRVTIINRMAVLREFSKYGTRQRVWAVDPFLDIEPLRRPVRLPRPFLPSERDALMALTLNAEDTALRAILYYGGLRAEETTRLRVKDVQPPLPQGRAEVHVRGKGDKERTVMLSPGAWALLEPYIKAKADEALRPGAFFFVHDDGAPWTTKMIQRRMTAWGKRAGVDCTAHKWRHSHATDMLRGGASLREIQLRLGHASITTTQMYLGLTDEDRMRAADILDGILGRDSGTGSTGASQPESGADK